MLQSNFEFRIRHIRKLPVCCNGAIPYYSTYQFDIRFDMLQFVCNSCVWFAAKPSASQSSANAAATAATAAKAAATAATAVAAASKPAAAEPAAAIAAAAQAAAVSDWITYVDL
jgi:hypothetical protein